MNSNNDYRLIMWMFNKVRRYIANNELECSFKNHTISVKVNSKAVKFNWELNLDKYFTTKYNQGKLKSVPSAQ